MSRNRSFDPSLLSPEPQPQDADANKSALEKTIPLQSNPDLQAIKLPFQKSPLEPQPPITFHPGEPDKTWLEELKKVDESRLRHQIVYIFDHLNSYIELNLEDAKSTDSTISFHKNKIIEDLRTEVFRLYEEFIAQENSAKKAELAALIYLSYLKAIYDVTILNLKTNKTITNNAQSTLEIIISPVEVILSNKALHPITILRNYHSIIDELPRQQVGFLQKLVNACKAFFRNILGKPIIEKRTYLEVARDKVFTKSPPNYQESGTTFDDEKSGTVLSEQGKLIDSENQDKNQAKKQAKIQAEYYKNLLRGKQAKQEFFERQQVKNNKADIQPNRSQIVNDDDELDSNDELDPNEDDKITDEILNQITPKR